MMPHTKGVEKFKVIGLGKVVFDVINTISDGFEVFVAVYVTFGFCQFLVSVPLLSPSPLKPAVCFDILKKMFFNIIGKTPCVDVGSSG